MRNTRGMDAATYLALRLWACEKAPTGAHHWQCQQGSWCCVYCGEQQIVDREGNKVSPVSPPNVP